MTTQDTTLPRTAWPAAVVCGFAAALSMWAVGFFGKLPGLAAPNAVVLALLLLALPAAGFYCARRTDKPVRAAAAAGLIAGLVNLLVLLSVIGREPDQLSRLWIPGSLALQIALCALGGFVGGLLPARAAADWHQKYAALCVAGTLVLISIGGLVTTLQVGLAVPDWPNTYETLMFLFPLSKMVGGIYHEHAHRLFGSLIGLMMIVLAVWTWRSPRRAWVRVYAGGLLALVIAQGVMGGLRVTEISTTLAAVHGVTAQTFVALTGGLALVLSTAWRRGASAADESLAGLRPLALAALLAVWVQLGLGAWLRHFNQGLHVHLAFAAVVAFLGFWLGAVILNRTTRSPLVPWLAITLMTLLLCQIMLGAGAWMFRSVGTAMGQSQAAAVWVTTAHVVMGAAVLTVQFVLTLQLFRCTAGAQRKVSGAVHVAA